MTSSNYTEAYLRQRKFYLLLPILALPFLTFIYWKLVVKNLQRSQLDEDAGSGLQLSLPSADLKKEHNMDKLAYYRKADQDSTSRAQQIKKDPYRQGEYAASADSSHSVLMGLAAPGGKSKRAFQFSESAKPQSTQEKAVHQRLRALDQALTAAPAPSFEQQENKTAPEAKQPAITQLEKMMAELQNGGSVEAQDPEMAQLDGMLDKLLKLQGGQAPEDPVSTSELSKSRPGLAVTGKAGDDPVTLLGAIPDSTSTRVYSTNSSGFFGLNDDNLSSQQASLTAVIEKTQQIVSGNTVQLRLTSALTVGEAVIPENSFVYGIAALSGERLKIKITSLRSAEQILPVSLSVYDMDGIEGIFIPGAIERTVTKQQLGSQIQGSDLDIDGFSIGAQAASAGVQMGKMLLSRKTRLTQVTLKQGYKVLLRDPTTTNL